LKERVKLIQKYELAGIATWTRYLGNNSVWNVIDLRK
jgi:spore germination protein YaaH